MARHLPEGLLWYYTVASGFRGISSADGSRGTLWATQLSFLNDRTEGVHAGSLLASALWFASGLRFTAEELSALDGECQKKVEAMSLLSRATETG